jgi:hypothetical protein
MWIKNFQSSERLQLIHHYDFITEGRENFDEFIAESAQIKEDPYC